MFGNYLKYQFSNGKKYSAFSIHFRQFPIDKEKNKEKKVFLSH